MKMQSIFPTANLRFHDALDRMEEEINMAQNILKRDLALHRVMERQKAEKALAPPQQSQQEPVQTKAEDVVMTNGHGGQKQQSRPVQENNTNNLPQPAVAPTRQMEMLEPKKEESLPPASLPAPQPAPVAPMVAAPAPASISVLPATQPTTTAATEQPPDEALPTGELAVSDADLFEFFGDDAMDGVDAANAADDPMGHLVDNTPGVSSLLPGLESYANIPDDTAMPDVPSEMPEGPPAPLQPNNTDANGLAEFNFGNVPTTQGAAPGQQQTLPDTTGQPDFGDIDFGSFDVGDGSGGGGDDGGQQGDNTFADLFDMDQYDFGGGGGGGGGGDGGQDISDWMNNL
jgi:hypothetical protein